jgi:hypothetical protein
VNCKQCGKKAFGGSEGRKAARLCTDCWEDTIEGRLEQSKRRRAQYVGRGYRWEYAND